jgi:hypothetical protein
MLTSLLPALHAERNGIDQQTQTKVLGTVEKVRGVKIKKTLIVRSSQKPEERRQRRQKSLKKAAKEVGKGGSRRKESFREKQLPRRSKDLLLS